MPKSSDLAVSIPQSFSGGEQITATNKGHTISFGVASGNENVALSKTAAVKAVEGLPSSIAADVSVETLANAELSATATVGKVDTVAQIEAYNSEKTTVDNQAGALVYDKIFPNADLEYIVTGNSIKENVVVYQPQTEYIYNFDMDFGGLTPVAQEDGSYKLVDSAKPEEPVFVLAAPYMYDANGEESYEVEMSLTQNGGNYLLTLTADEEWINSSERAFPVVIDPTVYYDFDDVFVMDGLLNQNTTKINKELRVGRNLTNLTRTYIKISDEMKIEFGSHIIDARLILHLDHYYEALNEEDISIQLYDCKNVPNWTATSVTWNNQPFGNTENSHKNSTYDQYRLDSISVKHKDEPIETYRFNITETVRNWIMTGVNKGFMLASSNESSKIQIDFHSSRSDVSKPLIQVNFREANIDPDSWETGKDAATSPDINVNTTASWTLTANQPWISVSATSGMGVGTFNVSVTENPSANYREGTVTVALSTDKTLTLTVWQGGSTAYFSADKDSLYFSYKGSDNPDNQTYWVSEDYLTKVVDINTNYDWTSRVEYEGGSTGWLSDEIGQDGNLYLTALGTNTANDVRKATVFIESGETILHEINVTQLDEISSYFNQLNADDPSKAKTSSDYNHPLATWAMKLSYAAYNYPSGLALPLIPGLFMGDMSDTATDILHEYGFVDDHPEDDVEENIWEVNYVPVTGIAAHTIGHREITIINNSTTGDDNNDISSTSVTSVDISNGNFSSDNANCGVYTSNNNGTESICIRQLVVVSVRGSVSLRDWAIDLANQINSQRINFETGYQEIIDSLYGVEHCEEHSSKNLNCEKCIGYLASKGITNPIILITGHSLGAAVANLVADELNKEEEQADVYAYTFATPNTINEAQEQSVPHTNVFNILNNNDLIPHFPMDDPGDNPTNVWVRHGQDFHITMPWDHLGIGLLDTDLLGVLGHGMPTYYAWMNNLPNTFAKPAEDITVTDLNEISEDFAVGCFAKALEAKCPVSVTLYDTDGNIVAYESQQEGTVYPEITDTGIVSWITEDGGKMFLIPYGTKDIEARIEAYDYGTMTLTVEQPGLGEPIDTITYNNVNLYPDKEFKVNIDEEFTSEGVALKHVVTNEDGTTIETEITDLNPYLISASVDVDEVVHGQPCTMTFVTHKDAVKTQIQYNGTVATVTFSRDHPWIVSLVEDGDTLIWTIQPVLNRIGEHVFDVNVKVGSTWYHTEKVFPLTIT